MMMDRDPRTARQLLAGVSDVASRTTNQLITTPDVNREIPDQTKADRKRMRAENSNSPITDEQREAVAQYFKLMQGIFGKNNVNAVAGDTENLANIKRTWVNQISQFTIQQMQIGAEHIMKLKMDGELEWFDLGKTLGAIRDANRSHKAHKPFSDQPRLPRPESSKAAGKAALADLKRLLG